VILATAATIIVMLLLCPAVTRMVRVPALTDQGTTYTPSFQRSLDVPPDPHVLLPDVTIVPVAAVPATPFRSVSWQRPTDDALTWSFLGSSIRPLRAPPVRLS